MKIECTIHCNVIARSGFETDQLKPIWHLLADAVRFLAAKFARLRIAENRHCSQSVILTRDRQRCHQ